MAVKLYEIHSELFKALGDNYSKLGKSDLIKLDLLTKVLIDKNVGFKFLSDGNKIYMDLDTFDVSVWGVISKLKYELAKGGRIRIL